MFRRVLIANRGEIACRIIKTLRRLGIQSIAIYSDVDSNALHVREADEAYLVGSAPALKSYLNIPAIIRIAQETQAEAIHPGYGFLSENVEMAQACQDAGIIFIGPSIAAMEAMASKQLAKQQLENTTVPLTPGYHGDEQSDERLLQEAQRIGFPVLLKAALGGGGKGMRAVYQANEFEEALAGARREAHACFANDTMLIEKLILAPRHIEVQIMADNHGEIVYLFERDCSIQRRHQKIIEEAPAPHISSALRKNIASAAIEVAKAIQYSGAGTVEFLLTRDNTFYFMEMNTRLQVEHPVTEMITGLDLVEWQLRIAANEPLPCKQDAIQYKGHAIECRIYAEDPYHHFLPSVGEVTFLKEPSGEGIRLDCGIRCHDKITQYYDPMIAKLIVWGEDRTQASARLSQALSNYHIGGLKTNIPFLRSIVEHPDFANAQLSTDFLDAIPIESPTINTAFCLQIAAAADYHRLTLEKSTLDQATIGWQMHLSPHWTIVYKINDETHTVAITPLSIDSCHIEYLETSVTMHVHQTENDLFVYSQQLGFRQGAHERGEGVYMQYMTEAERMCNTAENSSAQSIDNGSCIHQMTIQYTKKGIVLYLSTGPVTIEYFCWDSRPQASVEHSLTAPMPATVVAILKKQGESVNVGDRLIVLEAMKMEHTIHAPYPGKITDIYYTLGTQVHEGALLLALEPLNDSSNGSS